MKHHHVATNELVADVLTKPLSRVEFKYFIDNLVWSLARGSEELHLESGHSSRASHVQGRCGLLYSYPV